MERCCSSEYISRIVTSLIFMEILSIIVVRIVLYIGIGKFKDWSGAQQLVEHTRKEEEIRDIISTIILCLITLGYFHILLAFLSCGKKGHMHWFYVSLLIQHFLNSLIAGSIGFWDVGLALWYLVTLPMAPIVIFFYQLYIHSWIRSHGPRDVEYLVVECQIWLALCISSMATACWIYGYANPPKTAQLNLDTPDSSTSGNIKVHPGNPVSLQVYTVTGQTAEATISAKPASVKDGTAEVKIYSITVNVPGGSPPTVIVYPATGGNVTVTAKVKPNQTVKITVTATVDNSKNEVTITITGKAGTPLWYGKVTGVTGNSANISKIALDSAVTKEDGRPADSGHSDVTVTGYTCYPNYGFYISGISSVTSLWNENWDGGRCTFAEYYNSSANNNSPALLKLHISGGDTSVRYYGKNSATDWKKITSETDFNEKVKELVRTGTLSGSLGSEDQGKSPTSNIDYSKAFNQPVWFPLLMQGLSVGAVGSIFPNLIPKTLTCPKTSRSLSVINMFLVTVPHIFNVMLGDMDLLGRIGVGVPWDDTGHGWHYSLLLYLFYTLALLFAIFNIHYPEWRLSTFLRNNTWMVFLMILFTDVLNETFNAISRAGICSQRSVE